MRTVPTAWAALETSRQRGVALLIHIYAKRGGRVTLPDGWGSWTYSVGFGGNVEFADVANYAGDWADANTPTSRIYVPAAIEFDASQVFRQERVGLDPHSVSLTIDPELEPFKHYVNRQWPLTFGIVIYKVHRDGTAIATVDDGTEAHNQVPVVDVAFVGFLDADDTLYTNSAGLEKTIQDGKLKLETKWDHITRVFQREVPRPIFSIDCPKTLFSTGPASIACNADMGNVQIDGQVVAANGNVVSAVEWGTQDDAWFAQGRLEYVGHDSVSDLEFGFALNVISSTQRTFNAVTYGDLTLEMFPPLPIVGALASAFGGCDRRRVTCLEKHVPNGSDPPPPGAFTPGSLAFQVDLVQPTHAFYFIVDATTVKLVYNGTDTNVPQGIVIGVTPWDPTWTVIGTHLHASEDYATGLPTTPNYHCLIENSGNTAQIWQQPNAANAYTLVVICRAVNGLYDFIVRWAANAGQPVNQGNLQNFGGTDIPVEHPSMETAP